MYQADAKRYNSIVFTAEELTEIGRISCKPFCIEQEVSE